MTLKSHDTVRRGLFAGSFNPFTKGHADIVERALGLMDSIVVCIGVNRDKPGDAESAEARAEAIRSLYASDPRVEVVVWMGLTVDAAARFGASVLVRGVRSVKDFEYELSMADINRDLSGIETILLVARPEYANISSSLVRELQSYGHDVSKYLP